MPDTVSLEHLQKVVDAVKAIRADVAALRLQVANLPTSPAPAAPAAADPWAAGKRVRILAACLAANAAATLGILVYLMVGGGAPAVPAPAQTVAAVLPAATPAPEAAPTSTPPPAAAPKTPPQAPTAPPVAAPTLPPPAPSNVAQGDPEAARKAADDLLRARQNETVVRMICEHGHLGLSCLGGDIPKDAFGYLATVTWQYDNPESKFTKADRDKFVAWVEATAAAWRSEMSTADRQAALDRGIANMGNHNGPLCVPYREVLEARRDAETRRLLEQAK